MTGLVEGADFVAEKFREVCISSVASYEQLVAMDTHSRLSEATKSPSGLDMGVGGEKHWISSVL